MAYVCNFKQTFFEVNHPSRGDVFVFHFRQEPSVDYIKRVVGLREIKSVSR